MTESALKLQPGCEAVAVLLKIGPKSQQVILSLSDTPGDVDDIVSDLRAKSRPQRKGSIRSIAAAVRKVVASQEVERLAPGNDGAFLADLRLLAAVVEVEGAKVLAEAGIARLARLRPEWPVPEWVGVTFESGTVH